jgi:hypothetical protein
VTRWGNKVHSVEISGWDVDREFFVERTSLYIDQSGATTVILRNRLREGLLVFVRLLSTTFSRKIYPRVYRVDASELPDNTGFSRIRLTPSGPRRDNEYHATSESPEHLSLQERKSRVKA